MKSLGQVACDAYFEYSKGKSLTFGLPVPSFAAQSEVVKAAWESAAEAVAAALLDAGKALANGTPSDILGNP